MLTTGQPLRWFKEVRSPPYVILHDPKTKVDPSIWFGSWGSGPCYILSPLIQQPGQTLHPDLDTGITSLLHIIISTLVTTAHPPLWHEWAPSLPHILLPASSPGTSASQPRCCVLKLEISPSLKRSEATYYKIGSISLAGVASQSSRLLSLHLCFGYKTI